MQRSIRHISWYDLYSATSPESISCELPYLLNWVCHKTTERFLVGFRKGIKLLTNWLILGKLRVFAWPVTFYDSMDELRRKSVPLPCYCSTWLPKLHLEANGFVFQRQENEWNLTLSITRKLTKTTWLNNSGFCAECLGNIKFFLGEYSHHFLRYRRNAAFSVDSTYPLQCTTIWNFRSNLRS